MTARHVVRRRDLFQHMSHVAWSALGTQVSCANGWTDQDAIWPADMCESNEPCIRWGLVPRPPPKKNSTFQGTCAGPLKSMGIIRRRCGPLPNYCNYLFRLLNRDVWPHFNTQAMVVLRLMPISWITHARSGCQCHLKTYCSLYTF